jgi:hypothetical protein
VTDLQHGPVYAVVTGHAGFWGWGLLHVDTFAHNTSGIVDKVSADILRQVCVLTRRSTTLHVQCMISRSLCLVQFLNASYASLPERAQQCKLLNLDAFCSRRCRPT